MTGLVSVIIPAFNVDRFLRRAVDSVFAQTYQDFEIIIVNDGSTDGTEDLANELAAADSRISVVHQENRGLSGARNTGLRQAQGDFIQLLDADDVLLSHKLDVQVAYLRENVECSMVYGEGIYVEKGQEVSVEYPPPEGGVLRELLIRNFILVNAGIFRRSVISQIGYFKESSQSRYPLYGCEDWDYWLRMALMGHRIDEVKGAVVCNHWHGTNMSLLNVEMRRSHLWVLVEALQDRSRLSWSQKRLLNSQIVYRHFLYMKSLEESGQRNILQNERQAPIPLIAGGLSRLPYVLANLVSREDYPQLAGFTAYLLGKVSQRVF